VGTAGQNGKVDRSSVAQGGRIPIAKPKLTRDFITSKIVNPKRQLHVKAILNSEWAKMDKMVGKMVGSVGLLVPQGERIPKPK